MTSSALHSVEPLLETTVEAGQPRILQLDRWQLVGHEELVGLSKDCDAISSKCEQVIVGAEERVRASKEQDRRQSEKQTRSGSSDSGQLSLISSFGSLSFGGYQFTPTSPFSTNTSSDSASRQSMSIVDIDQHHFYCSLMLLNSLDLNQYKVQQKTSSSSVGDQQQQQLAPVTSSGIKSKAPSASLSSTELGDSNRAEQLGLHHKSLQDCRCLAGNERQPSDRTACKEEEKFKGKRSVGSDSKKGSSGFGVLAGGWQGEKAGKLFAAAAAATNSSSFVDKLLAHMINSGGGSGSKKDKQRQEQPMTMTENNSRSAKNSEKSTLNSSELLKKKTAQTGGGGSVGSGLNLLTDLSRRFARRCGVKTKAVQLASSASCGSHSAPSESDANVSAFGLKRNDNCEKKSSKERSGKATGCGANTEQSKAKVFASSLFAACDKQSPVSTSTSTDQVKCKANNDGRSHGNHHSMHAHPGMQSKDQVRQMKVKSSDESEQLIEHLDQRQLQVQNRQTAVNNNYGSNINSINNLIKSSSNNTGTNLISSNNLNSSISTLSNCCHCDNETCSSSGFVSSSTTDSGAGGGVASGTSAGGISSSAGFGGNCGDSTTTSHSCNSSSHNDSYLSVAAKPTPSASCNSSYYALGSDKDNSGIDSSSLQSQAPRFRNTSQDLAYYYCDRTSSKFVEGERTGERKQQNQTKSISEADMTAVAPALSSASSPVHLAAHAESQPKLSVDILPEQQLVDARGGQQLAATEIQVSSADDHLSESSHQESRSSVGSSNLGYPPSMKEKTGNHEGYLKPKVSLLARARNSTINLASLATVTNRFSSASVGNLWHGVSDRHHVSGHNHNDLATGELADNSADSGIRPLDYTARGAFDCYSPEEGEVQGQLPSNKSEPRSIKSTSGNKLLSVASCGSTRKLSTKEKCKRQKEAERVEKLRLLVSYLKSGSSQPVVSPVALEADEIELAERYKLHVILRDDLLRDIQSSEQPRNPQSSDQMVSPSSGSISGSDNNAENKQQTQVEKPKQLEQLDDHGSTIVNNKNSSIHHSIGCTTTSSPASSSSSSSMNHSVPFSTSNGRSVPHIGNVTWVLRHSISDPGNNNFEHSPSFSVASSSSPSAREHHHNNHHHKLHHHRNHQTHDILHHHEQTNKTDGIGQCGNKQETASDQCGSCAPSTSYSGSSLSNYCLGSNSNNKSIGASTAGAHTEPLVHHQNQQRLPKLFYIDDMDPIPILSSSSPITATNPISASSAQGSSSAKPTSPSISATALSFISQPSTPAIRDANVVTPGTNDRQSGSAWTNPQNLAIWIDNEVNSLVNDLEAKSQQLKVKNDGKHTKGGKRKWLSVTGSHSSRRSSAGANST